MHSRRARPTLRVLRDDLTSGWASPFPRRVLADGQLMQLHPLSELDHPLILKAAESIGTDPSEDSDEGRIRGSTLLHLREIKISQWRGGVWCDSKTGVNWLVVAGLAKNNHKAFDDFYVEIERAEAAGSTSDWLPSNEDLRLLKQETSARLLTEWELSVQRAILGKLRTVAGGGSARLVVSHPLAAKGILAELTIEVTPVRDSDYEADEIQLTVETEAQFKGSDLEWQLTLRALISLSPPEQGWDRLESEFTNIAEPGAWQRRVQLLETITASGELAQSQPGQQAHYTHTKHLAGSTIEGTGVRALCGAFFVPRQDHESLPSCPQCTEQLDKIPA